MKDIDELLSALIERRGSDLHLKVGRPPLFRIAGKMVPTEFPVLDEESCKDLVYSMMSAAQIETFEASHELDFSYGYGQVARFRINAFQQRGHSGAVMRLVPAKVPTIDSLKLPAVLKDIATRNQGLVLVTGPTGSGKSTTLAAMIEYVNETRQAHIMTVEDPIEFVYTDNNSVINQRELGLDTFSFPEALKHVLRQDPDVILIGEMRDPETITTAITAAETGHLVFSTLHTIDSGQSVDRVIDSFPTDQQQQIRIQLAATLQAVVSQRLCRRADGGGRVPAMEIMINSPTVRKHIEEGRTGSIHKTIEESVTHYRMQTLNQSLLALASRGFITFEEAMTATNNPDEFKLYFHRATQAAAAAAAPAKPA